MSLEFSWHLPVGGDARGELERARAEIRAGVHAPKTSDQLYHQEYFDALASIDALPGVLPFQCQVPR